MIVEALPVFFPIPMVVLWVWILAQDRKRKRARAEADYADVIQRILNLHLQLSMFPCSWEVVDVGSVRYEI